jgi:Ca-activated chloride channel family protein
MSRITAAYGADPRAVYDSLRAPSPVVVEAIITSWRNQVKKPSRVALVVDSSGSMKGDKLPSAQRSLQAYLAQTGPRDVLGLIDFDSSVGEPVVVRGGPADAAKAMTFVSGLKAEGGTSLYDAVEAGRNWLRRTRRPDEILAVVVLTDGNDSGSKLSLQALEAELRRSGFASDDRIGVFTIGYGSSGEYNADALRRIAESNGGVFVEGTPDSILKRMEQLQLAF